MNVDKNEIFSIYKRTFYLKTTWNTSFQYRNTYEAKSLKY